MNKRLTVDADARSKTHMQKFPDLRKMETSNQQTAYDRRFTTLTKQASIAESQDVSHQLEKHQTPLSDLSSESSPSRIATPIELLKNYNTQQNHGKKPRLETEISLNYIPQLKGISSVPKLGLKSSLNLPNQLEMLKQSLDRRHTDDQIFSRQNGRQMKVSHSVRNLARHKVIGSIEDYSTQEQKRKDRLRLSV